VARNLSSISSCELVWCCDVDPTLAEDLAGRFPGARFAADLDSLLAAGDVDAVAIATPVATHAELAERALRAGLDCFVEKPLARDVATAVALAELADEHERVLMVGHLLEYHPALEALRRLIADGELGDVHYIHSRRLNLGKLRVDENALWSLGAHDVSAFLALAGELPVEAIARGESYVHEGVEDVAFGFLRFPSGITAHMHLSWLDPHKERKLTVVGSQRMATFDDMEPERKLTVFDSGIDSNGAPSGGYEVRSGAAHHPGIRDGEPLALELEHFVDSVARRSRPRTDGEAGVRVVRVLEALQTSLSSQGEPVGLDLGAPL
jgi:predicted dehydrogenase